MVRFLLVKTTHPKSDSKFNVSVAYLRLIILSVIDGVPVNSEPLFDQLRKSQDQDGTVFQRWS
jgi:hypothetical protein